MSDVTALFSEMVGSNNLLTGDAIAPDHAHNGELTKPPQKPGYVAKPSSAEEVARLLMAASEHGVPVTARGSGSGLSGAARPREGGLLISFERMNAVLEVDTINQVAVVQPGVTLSELDAATADTGLRYMVHPGELSSSVGGNVGTNASGVRAVKYGVARHNVLGLQAVLPTGEIIRTGGKIAKVSTGYDLTQLIVGSEGTLALATEVIVKLHPRLSCTPRVVSSYRAVATSRTERPRRSTATTTSWSPPRSQPMHSVHPGRSLPALPEAVSVKTRSGVMPAAAIASCCWSRDCCPVDTRRYVAVLMVTMNHRRPTFSSMSDPEEVGLAL